MIADDREAIMLKQCHDQFTTRVAAALESFFLKKKLGFLLLVVL
jgi:hypothetical protein